MMRSEASGEGSAGWQLILADLALILFLVTLAALAGFPEDGAAQEGGGEPAATHFAPSQALYRPGPGSPSLGQWLARQAPDPRATLTIYAAGGEREVWDRARALAAEAEAAPEGVRVRVRIVIEPEGARALHASLGYDAAPAL